LTLIVDFKFPSNCTLMILKKFNNCQNSCSETCGGCSYIEMSSERYIASIIKSKQRQHWQFASI